MSYQIAGRTVKNEYLSIATLATTFGAVMAYRSTKSAKVEEKSASPPIQASGADEEKFIKEFMAEAEKNGAKH